MLNEILFGEVTSVAGSMGLPALSFSVNVMVGIWPAAPLSTFTRVITMPGAVADSWGRMWAPWMDASNSSSPLGVWQEAHWLSSTCGRFTWLAPVAKLTSSWQGGGTGGAGGGGQAEA